MNMGKKKTLVGLSVNKWTTIAAEIEVMLEKFRRIKAGLFKIKND